MASNAILDRYIQQLMETSTPEAPAWNIEKIRAGKKNTWNYIDGCMIKALIELYGIRTNLGAFLSQRRAAMISSIRGSSSSTTSSTRKATSRATVPRTTTSTT